MRDPGPEAGRVVEPERRVVGEPGRLELGQVAVRVEPEEVIALASHRAGELLQPFLLSCQARTVLRSRVAAVEADLGSTVEQRLDEARAQPLVGLRGGPVELVRVIGHQEERGRSVVATLVGEDAVEAPEGIGSPHLVERRRSQPARLAQARADPAPKQIALCARSRAPQPRRSPLPGRVDVVGKRDGEPGTAPARRLGAEPAA